jgi:hypothetical protein
MQIWSCLLLSALGPDVVTLEKALQYVAGCLSDRHLNAQMNEARIVLRAVQFWIRCTASDKQHHEGENKQDQEGEKNESPYHPQFRPPGWSYHPAVITYQHYPHFLKHYFNAMRTEWLRRGHRCSHPAFSPADQGKDDDLDDLVPIEAMVADRHFPSWWLTDAEFHECHRRQLLAKDSDHYSQVPGWTASGTIDNDNGVAGIAGIAGYYWYNTDGLRYFLPSLSGRKPLPLKRKKTEAAPPTSNKKKRAIKSLLV